MNGINDKPQTLLDAANSSSDTHSSRGLLVVGHGTRDPAGIAEFLAVSQRIAVAVAPLKVEASFLELADPTIDAGIARLAAAGVRELTVAPLILFAAGHAKQDIPRAVAQAVARHSGMAVRQLPHLGCHAELLALSERRFREACAARDASGSPPNVVWPHETLLLMVGRGSHDPEATAEMHRFANLRLQASHCGRLEVAFTAMAEPGLDEALENAARLPYHRVVVQPHLLFAGVLLERVREQVAEAARRFPDRQWVTTGHLGPEPEVVNAVAASLFSSPAAGTCD
ncbi:MAG: sirohydrochlorin chelatase [Planctomycetia bacterium]|nr:sirohydrochlorin chelatase [Planctomycetia bacterium]